MALLVCGLLLWSGVHFIPSIGIALKTSVVDRFGNNVYMAVFSLLIVASIVLMVFGWRSTTPTHLYALPAFVKPISLILLVGAFFLFGAAKHPTRIKRAVRHPQLTSIIVWSSAHLLVNGDSRSLVLFGGLACWAVMEIVLINRREGEWVKPEAPPWGQEVKGGLISIAIFVVAVLLHPYIAGVPVR